MANDNVGADSMRQDCWTSALHAHGTSHIFQRRARRLGLKLRLLTYTGIALPLVVGATALSFSLEIVILPTMMTVVATLLILQLLTSTWAVAAHWVDRHIYANESATANDELARRYAALAKSPPLGADFKTEYDLITADNRNRNQQDMKQGVTAKEKREGMRAALRQYQRRCATCGETPTSMKPTDCDTCGNF